MFLVAVKLEDQNSQDSKAQGRSSSQSSSSAECPHEGHDAIEALRLDIYWARRDFEKKQEAFFSKIKECQEGMKKLADAPSRTTVSLNSHQVRALPKGADCEGK